MTDVSRDKRHEEIHAAGLGLDGGTEKYVHGEWEGQASP